MTDGLPTTGRVVVLNGAPRTGKSSIADVLVQHGWRGLGVDSVVRDVDEALRPSIGLRPGGERPDLEPHVRERYRVLFDEVGRLADSGDDVVVDVGLHADYAEPFDAWELAHEVLGSAEAWWIAVDCPLDEALLRRAASPGYVTADDTGAVPEPVRRWHEAVHDGHRYDAAIDTSMCEPTVAAEFVLRLVGAGAAGDSASSPLAAPSGTSVAGQWLGRALGLGSRRTHHVAVVGAGGKSTTVANLARHLAQTGPTVMTTTTKMGADQDAGWHVVTGPDPLAQLASAQSSNAPVVVWGEIDGERAIGVSVEVADRLHDEVGHVVNEADGARRRSFKAPGSYEPVVAPSTTLVVSVAGVDALGGVIGDTAHRPGIVAELADCSTDDPLTAKAMARVLLHEQGQRRSVPVGADFCIVLSKVGPQADTTGLVAELRSVATIGVLHHRHATG